MKNEQTAEVITMTTRINDVTVRIPTKNLVIAVKSNGIQELDFDIEYKPNERIFTYLYHVARSGETIRICISRVKGWAVSDNYKITLLRILQPDGAKLYANIIAETGE